MTDCWSCSLQQPGTECSAPVALEWSSPGNALRTFSIDGFEAKRAASMGSELALWLDWQDTTVPTQDA